MLPVTWLKKYSAQCQNEKKKNCPSVVQCTRQLFELEEMTFWEF